MILRPYSRFGLTFLLLCAGGLFLSPTPAAARSLGDVDNDGIFTVMDLAKQIAAANGRTTLPEADRIYADLNADGVLNDKDSAEITKLILGTQTPATLAAASVRETSPAAGESGVSLTREFVVRFTMPLALDTVLSTVVSPTGQPGNLYAEFGGRRLLARAEVSSDRLKATLFFLEPLPASARIHVTFNPAGIKDLLGRELDPAGNGTPCAIVTYDYDTASINVVAGTAIIGHVLASERAPGQTNDTPIPGALVRVLGSETLFTRTAADGSFKLMPCPAGRFFVEVDGRTSSLSSFPGGAYYPYIVKAWETAPGRADNLAAGTGKIYLPLVPATTLQPVSASASTTIGFAPSVAAANPVLAGVEIYVPANSLFADDGTRGGKVGLAPVASDRLPEPLPPGLRHTLDISIQTDGATNFDRPVPVRFPNLPDPVTGIKLRPGAKSALWSFNHDKGIWEIAGPMTVTEDGNFVVTDAGVGVRQPGWHGSNPGTGGDGGEPKPPDPDDPPDDLKIIPGAYKADPKIVVKGDSINLSTNHDDSISWSVSQSNGQVTYGATNSNNITLVGAKESTSIDDVVITATRQTKKGSKSTTYSVTVLSPLEIAVDADRDSVIRFDASDATTASRPHAFWTNADQDNQAIKSPSDIMPAKGEGFIERNLDDPLAPRLNDSTKSGIQGLGDLQDFDRIAFKGKPILRSLLQKGYRLESVAGQDRAPASAYLNIFPYAGSAPNNDLSYLTEPEISVAQIAKLPFETNNIFSPERIAELRDDLNLLLYEGKNMGEFSLRFRLVNSEGREVADSNGLFMSLRPMSSFYDLYSPLQTDGISPAIEITTPYYKISGNYKQLRQAADWHLRKGSEYLLFVHGTRQRPEDRIEFAETAFKRLFWSGYRGRVGLFSWPTDWYYGGRDFGDFEDAVRALYHFKNYDRSERRAYYSATSLRGLLEGLRQSRQQLTVLAHSMGNVVTSEALRLASDASERGLVDAYIASQSATTGNSYDSAARLIRAGSLANLDSGDLPLKGITGVYAILNEEVPDKYAGRYANIDISASKIVNLYNVQDYALSGWRGNQWARPDDADGIDDTLGGKYFYDNVSGEFRFGTGTASIKLETDLRLPGAPEGLYAVLSHVAEARSWPMGAIELYGVVSANVNLQSSQFSFTGDGWDHSGQFNRPFTNSGCRAYWKEVIRQAGFSTVGAPP